jgi:hypothetical protein
MTDFSFPDYKSSFSASSISRSFGTGKKPVADTLAFFLPNIDVNNIWDKRGIPRTGER